MTRFRSLLQLAGAAGVGSAGWLAGVSWQQRRQVESGGEKQLGPFMLSASVGPPVALSPPGDLVPDPGPGAPRVAQIMRFGFPGLDQVRAHQDYVMSYDRRNKVPHWVFEHLTRDNVHKTEGVDRAKCDFVEDKSIHPYFRSLNTDYKYSGFDRGHMAPAGNHRKTQEMCNETFLLTNMAPQVGKGFNRDKWEHLERYVRKLTKLYRNVYVCTGPLYLPHLEQDGRRYIKFQVIGDNNVSVPTHFFKVVVGELDDGFLELESFVMPNRALPDETALSTFHVPLDSVERAAGLLLFDRANRDRLTRINGVQA